MAVDLVRARLNGVETNVGRAYAIAKGLEVLDEPVRNRDGSLRSATRANGRSVKPRTSPAQAVAKKKATETSSPVPAE